MIADAQLVTVQALWDLLLAIVVLVVVPVVVFRAARLVQACRSIEQLFKTTLEAAAGVVENTRPAGPALDQTIAVASGMVETAGALEQHSGAVDRLLEQRAGIR